MAVNRETDGYGVFSKVEFKAGDFLLKYYGDKVTEEKGLSRMKRPKAENKLFSIHLKIRWGVLTKKHSDTYVKDAPDSTRNSVMKLNVFTNSEHLCLFTVKDIQAGQEILYSYGERENI